MKYIWTFPGSLKRCSYAFEVKQIKISSFFVLFPFLDITLGALCLVQKLETLFKYQIHDIRISILIPKGHCF